MDMMWFECPYCGEPAMYGASEGKKECPHCKKEFTITEE